MTKARQVFESLMQSKGKQVYWDGKKYTNANIQTQIITASGSSYTIRMPVGTTLETLVSWSAVNLGYNFFIINTASGNITLDATETGVSSIGSMTIATGTSAQFRIRRTAANTFIVYRLS